VPAPAAGQDGYESEPTRGQWVTQADSICKESGRKAKRLLDSIFQAGRKGKVVLAGRRLIRLGRLLLRVVGDVRAVPRPPEDANAIERALDIATRSNRLAIASGRAFTDRKVARGNALYRRGIRVGRKSAKPMKDFGLKHCV
jgi:hypothetical protein